MFYITGKLLWVSPNIIHYKLNIHHGGGSLFGLVMVIVLQITSEISDNIWQVVGVVNNMALDFATRATDLIELKRVAINGQRFK